MNTTTYRYVGSGEANIGGVKLTQFGTAVGLAPGIAEQAIRAGVNLLTDEEFQGLGFTKQDLAIWGSQFEDPFTIPAKAEDAEAKARFLRRKEQAQELFAINREIALKGE